MGGGGLGSSERGRQTDRPTETKARWAVGGGRREAPSERERDIKQGRAIERARERESEEDRESQRTGEKVPARESNIYILYIYIEREREGRETAHERASRRGRERQLTQYGMRHASTHAGPAHTHP